ncbi:DNA-processing protein DprA [Arthrobacter sp. FW306-06-A]|uniref:DNA-processing protein DprA n=1 Tax=Arthrobacter sp. FW306-06-A TaxID=2879621 RepID=UPI001EFFD54B|nr:DNA-processing protein DprA [Arthrobacter sp. FW306-06-A]UKA73446.1 DNA-processing protein DprA [Arthrobacter sp. FW306-06-A]
MTDENRIARAALTRMFAPTDLVARALVARHGAHAAYRMALGARPVFPFWDVTAEELADGLSRWAPHPRELDTHAAEADLATIERLGGGFLIPGDEHWPTGLDDLPDAPYGLWYRGDIGKGIPAPSRCTALTGSRDSTSYGAAVTGDIAYGLAQRGICVISGLAYGIDAHAHRAALAGSQGDGPATIAVLAGGLDRDYPSGNADLAAAIRANGLTLSELPPGAAPTRARFLQRGRIIAALAGVTCVVEARWRSGALNTAHHAETIARHVAAVPGSVHSANSAGCHRLLKEGTAALVTDAAELTELLAS